ncbi:MAG: CusA/CzcA family heavy metal efflux RND transporter [Thermoanaerobaculia bacterium]|nr:CusA/CzcA family heavy metal efflux RND transporter [Thermoanaerobaculia bacterium]MCZ7649825.1 efflux RND transporter permease subunit [Thermoanaerobaculia bacterium]
MNLLDRLIRFSLTHRLLVLSAAGLLLVFGAIWTAAMPVDIFPDLSAPTVTVVTEAGGMAPEEVEALVTFPIESAVNGATGIRRLRSVSGDGISVVWVEFVWGTDIYQARQVVTERLQRVVLPAQAERPELGPISSIMGEITFIALTGEGVSPMELRRLAETVVRRNLLAIHGVSQVVPIGGDVRQLQVTAHPEALAQHGIGLEEVIAATARASRSPAAGFHVEGGQEYLVRGLGRARHPDEVASTVVRATGGTPIRIGDLATVAWGPEPARGTASYKTKPAVILSVQKQPGANTLELTRTIDRALERIATALPSGVTIEKENFRQADFIAVAIRNVTVAMRDGGVLVVVILFLFLGSWRTTLISALSIPLALLAGLLVVSLFGGSINTMTLGGLTIAIGALVDDAIIDVENVFRRLRLERGKEEGQRRPPLEVVFRASSEVRKAIFFATVIIGLVFLPLFFLPGIEGRLLRPLGLSYVAALAASLLVSLTVTPVLCYLLLPGSKSLEAREPALLRFLHRAYRPSLELALRRRSLVLVATGATVVAALAILPLLGRSFLPPFNEGSLTVAVVSAPGIPLADSDALGRQVEAALLDFPEVVSTSRRTGRAEKDEHVQGVNASEMEVVLGPLEHGRDKERLLAEMRRAVATIPGVSVSFGQPISHRIDHMISGSKTNLAVKVFGPDLAVLRGLAGAVERTLQTVPGIVDLSNQEQAAIAQLVIDFDREAMARHGLTPAGLAEAVEALFQGVEAGELVDEGLTSRIVVRLPEGLRASRERLAGLPVTTSAGTVLALADVATVRFDLGPSMVRREDVQRVAMLTANVAGRDLAGTVERARTAVDAGVDLPTGYLVTFGGQFEEASRSARNLGLIAVLILLAMYGLLYVAFGTHRETLVVLVNLPLALIGGVFALSIGNGVLSVATLVGFVTLFGIATRNGVLLVTHYQHLIREEGLDLDEAVRRGSEERLAPILMTALTAGLALIPLVLHGNEAGNEIQSPMAQVILGGLLTSTFLNLVVVPALYERWGDGRRPPPEELATSTTE